MTEVGERGDRRHASEYAFGYSDLLGRSRTISDDFSGKAESSRMGLSVASP